MSNNTCRFSFRGLAYSLLCGTLMFALMACGGGKKSQGPGDTPIDPPVDPPVDPVDPVVYGSYGGGPGQPPARQVDPTNPNNANLDTDCDGISDADEIALTYTNASGAAQHTDPANPDTDNDGLPDGLEIGRTQVIEPDRCNGYFVADADPTTTTNPVNRDSDGDGVSDGVEDLNQNGRLDDGEGNPNDPADLGNPTVVNACSDANLAPVVFDRSQVSDLQMATRGFAEKQAVTVSAIDKGWLYWNATDQIAAFAIKKATVEADVSAMETAGQAVFASIGGTNTVSNPLVQTFTTWDGYPAVKATYNWSATGDAKALASSIAKAFAGADATGWSDTAGGPGPWILRVEYVRRSDNTAAVVGAFVPASLYTDSAKTKVDDVVNGSAFAQSDDTGSVKCQAFVTVGNSKLDILWVVDNSGSMNAHQTAVKNASDAMAQVLGNSTLDWRIGLVTTSYYDDNVTGRDRKDFTTNINTVKSWFARAENADGSQKVWQRTTSYALNALVSSPRSNISQNNYICSAAGTSSGSGNGPSTYANNIVDGAGTLRWNYDPTWVGTAGTGTEKGFASVKKALDDYFLNSSTPAAQRVRSDAKLMIIVLTDTQEQSGTGAATYTTYFQGLDAQVNGIVCQVDGANGCSDTETKSQKYMDVINAMGGVLASIKDFDTGTNTAAVLEAMVQNAAGATSEYILSKSPISSSFKVAMEGPTRGTCNGAPIAGPVPDVPRSQATGFDYYSPTNSLLFYGNCRPSTPGTDIATSYRYWVPGGCPADGCPLTCNPACVAPLLCSNGACVCPADCGGCASGKTCDQATCTCRSGMGG